jgi:hypothetical protein
MPMVVGFLGMAGMVMFVGTVPAAVFVIVGIGVGPVAMVVAVLVVMGMTVAVGVLVAVRLPVVGVFVRVGVLVFVIVVMRVSVFAFHSVLLLFGTRIIWCFPFSFALRDRGDQSRPAAVPWRDPRQGTSSGGLISMVTCFKW